MCVLFGGMVRQKVFFVASRAGFLGIILSVLTACGGGGGTGSSDLAPTATDSPPAEEVPPTTPLEITYSFPQSSGDYDPGVNWTGGFIDSDDLLAAFVPFDSQAQTSTRSLLGLWSRVANITFVEVFGAEAGEATLRFAASAADFGTGGSGFSGDIQGFSFPPGDTPTAGTVWLRSSLFTTLLPGGEGWRVFQHELGHALADFKHPLNVSFSMIQSGQFTIMGTPETSGGPLLLDVIRLQQMYGANMSTDVGDTVYDIGNLLEDLTGLEVIADSNFNNPSKQLALWDAGGEDTLDFSKAEGDAINLKNGSRSGMRFSPAKQIVPAATVSIAEGANIENVIGAGFLAEVIGNDLDNHIAVGNSNVVYGGGGEDTVHFRDGRTGYRIRQLQDGYEITLLDPNGESDYVNDDVERIAFNGVDRFAVHSQSAQSQASVLLASLAAESFSNTGNPIAGNDQFVVPLNGIFNLSLLNILENDVDPGNSGLDITQVTTSAQGVTVQMNGNSLEVNLAESNSGIVNLNYVLRAGNGTTDLGEITLYATTLGDVVIEKTVDSSFPFGFENHETVGQASFDGSVVLQTSWFGVGIWQVEEGAQVSLPYPRDYGGTSDTFKYGSLSKNGQYAVLFNPGEANLRFNVVSGEALPLDFIVDFPRSEQAYISDDGENIYFLDYAAGANLSDTFIPLASFHYDVSSGTTTQLLPNAVEGVGVAAMTPDARYLVIGTWENLVEGLTTNFPIAYHWDSVEDVYTPLLFTNEVGETQPVTVFDPGLTDDGRHVVFQTHHSLVVDDANGTSDIYVFDTQANQYQLISMTDLGEAATGPSFSPFISADGSLVTFRTWATNLHSGNAYAAIVSVNTQNGEQATVNTAYDLPVFPGSLEPGSNTFVAAETLFVSGDGRRIFYYDNGFHDFRTFGELGERVLYSQENPLHIGNVRPVAMQDDVALISTSVTIPAAELLANDIDWDGDVLSIVSVGDVLGGVASLQGDRILFEVTPPGSDRYSFTYVVSDSNGGYSEAVVLLSN